MRFTAFFRRSVQQEMLRVVNEKRLVVILVKTAVLQIAFPLILNESLCHERRNQIGFVVLVIAMSLNPLQKPPRHHVGKRLLKLVELLG